MKRSFVVLLLIALLMISSLMLVDASKPSGCAKAVVPSAGWANNACTLVVEPTANYHSTHDS
jgi:hypothetical protein